MLRPLGTPASYSPQQAEEHRILVIFKQIFSKQSKAEGKDVIYVKISLVPETRTVFVPKMELAKLA
jgi:hypothetical protein